MSNNLRVIYNNLLDNPNTTLAVSSTASSSFSGDNLRGSLKSLKWRSGTTSSTYSTTETAIVIGFDSAYIVSGIVLAFTNLGPSAKYRLRLWKGSSPVTISGTVDNPAINNSAGNITVYDSGASLTNFNNNSALGDFNWGLSPLGMTPYETGKSYNVIWLPSSVVDPCTCISIQLYDPGNTVHYTEISKLVVGTHWSPRYNTALGLSTSLKDLSTTERSEAGDLITNNGSQFSSLSFDLSYMNKQDRIEFTNIVKSKGTKKPIFISLFPNNIDDVNKEGIYEIYGKLVQTPSISHPIFDMYSSQVEIEEI